MSPLKKGFRAVERHSRQVRSESQASSRWSFACVHTISGIIACEGIIHPIPCNGARLVTPTSLRVSTISGRLRSHERAARYGRITSVTRHTRILPELPAALLASGSREGSMASRPIFVVLEAVRHGLGRPDLDVDTFDPMGSIPLGARRRRIERLAAADTQPWPPDTFDHGHPDLVGARC